MVDIRRSCVLLEGDVQLVRREYQTKYIGRGRRPPSRHPGVPEETVILSHQEDFFGMEPSAKLPFHEHLKRSKLAFGSND
jgi:hypothetical protein